MLLTLAPVAALPWLQGFFAPAASSQLGSYDCGRENPSPMSIVADVAPSSPGSEQILASYADGIVVLDRDHRPLAQTRGLTCEGTADELVAIAAGDAAIDVPLIAVAATRGGSAASTTTLTLLRVDARGTLEPVFSAEVERHERDGAGDERATRTGVVTLVPGGLVYRDLQGLVSLWTYEPDAGRYVESLATRPSA
jgi:hypothetical protein